MRDADVLRYLDQKRFGVPHRVAFLGEVPESEQRLLNNVLLVNGHIGRPAEAPCQRFQPTVMLPCDISEFLFCHIPSKRLSDRLHLQVAKSGRKLTRFR